MGKKNSIIDNKSATDFLNCTCLAFTMQVVVATIVMFTSSATVSAEQSKMSSIYETPGYLSKSTLLQFLIVSLLTALFRHIFFSGKIVKVPSIALRVTLMFTCEIAMLAVVIWTCGWFHSVSVAGWAGFVCGALPCLIAGIYLAFKSECKENEEMNAALKKKQEEENQQ